MPNTTKLKTEVVRDRLFEAVSSRTSLGAAASFELGVNTSFRDVEI